MLVSSVLCIFRRCTCEECATVNLSGALEHRFCHKIAQVRQKLCMTNHDDFAAMTNSVKSKVNKISRVYIYSTHEDSSFYSELVST